MLPKRVSIKLIAENPEVVNLAKLTPIFQRWIQVNALEGLLLDVADYKHVPQGPGIVLIGHEGDYAYELEGQAGLRFVYKQPSADTLVGRVQEALRLALQAVRCLEAESAVNGLRFQRDVVQLQLIDRLHYPNTPEAFDRADQALTQWIEAVFAGMVDIAHSSLHTKDLLTLTLRTPQIDLDAVIERLNQVAVAE